MKVGDMMGKICPCQKMHVLTYKTVFLDMTKLRAMENVIVQIDIGLEFWYIHWEKIRN